MVALGLHCWVGFSLVLVSLGYSVVVAYKLLIAAASLVAEHKRRLQQWGPAGSAVTAPRL